MARKRRIFGPLTYGTLALGVVAVAFSVYTVHWPAIQSRLDFRRHVDGLRSADPGVRSLAVQALVGQWELDQTRPHFLAMLDDERADVRVHGLTTLVSLGGDSESQTETLASAAKDPSASVRKVAAEGFASVASNPTFRPGSGREAARISSLATLRALLADPAPEVRVAAAFGLGGGRADRDSAPDLEPLLADPDRHVRLAAIKSLLEIRGGADPRANDALVALIVDPRPQVDRYLGVLILPQAAAGSTERAGLGLAGLLGSDDDAVKVDALQCLKLVGNPARGALPILEAMFRDEDEQSRSLVAEAIASIEPMDSPRSLKIRLGIVGDPKSPFEVRSAAIAAIRESSPAGLPDVATLLSGLLADPDARVRAQAYQLLGEVIHDTPAPAPQTSPTKP